MAGLGGRKRGRRRVRVDAPDGSLTGYAGLAALAEPCDGLGLAATLDRQVGAINRRAGGQSGGWLLVGLARAQLLGEDAGAGLDRLRCDTTSGLVASSRWLPSRTVMSLAGRFGATWLAGIDVAVAELTARWLRLLPGQRRAELVGSPPVIDLDATDVEVYGATKQGVADTCQGQRCGRPQLAWWPQGGITLAADLLAGHDDVRPRAAGLLRRALAGLPAKVCGRPRGRADAG